MLYYTCCASCILARRCQPRQLAARIGLGRARRSAPPYRTCRVERTRPQVSSSPPLPTSRSAPRVLLHFLAAACLALDLPPAEPDACLDLLPTPAANQLAAAHLLLSSRLGIFSTCDGIIWCLFSRHFTYVQALSAITASLPWFSIYNNPAPFCLTLEDHNKTGCSVIPA